MLEKWMLWYLKFFEQKYQKHDWIGTAFEIFLGKSVFECIVIDFYFFLIQDRNFTLA